MQVSRLQFCNFRCFGAEPVVIELSNLTTLIGANGAGKTAVLQGLLRLFGQRASDRRLNKGDFHVSPTVAADAITEISLWIEARLEFPALMTDANDASVPESFRQMVVAAPGTVPYCRVRLEGVCRRTAHLEGEIEERLYWITTAEDHILADAKRPMPNFERAKIQVLYVPASRDPASQMRQAAGALLQPLLKAIRWSEATKTAAKGAASGIRTAVQAERGMQKLEQLVAKEWRNLQDFSPLQDVKFQPINPDFDAVLRHMEAVFQPLGGTSAQPMERLSDGLRSLFYFSLLGARFDIERMVPAQGEVPAFEFDQDSLPGLVIFAIEEPENHLAPQYLARILPLLKRISAVYGTQVILTSHSPGILSRVEPECIRHIRFDRATHKIRLNKLTLPSATDDAGEAYKYIKEAVKAYPELYFSAGVVLGEGDSEMIVLPRVATAMGRHLDERFISVIPLGGRHVNHFWRLLRDLEIPHVTILDLDRERFGGGWGRIHYAVKQLQRFNPAITPQSFGVTQQQIDALPGCDWDHQIAQAWLMRLEAEGIFFSSPLDIDFSMLQAFPAAYMAATTGTGPRIPSDPAEYQGRLEQARFAVLKPEGGPGTTYTAPERAAFIWYHYLFLGRGKPSTHMRALASLDDAAIRASAPDVFKRLLNKIAPLPPPPPPAPPVTPAAGH